MPGRNTNPKPSLKLERAGDSLAARALADALCVEDPGAWGTHGFHTYPAGLAPRSAAMILEHLGIKAGDRVLDPFVGGGTVAVEAMRLGAQALGNDLSPVAVLVATGRTRLTTEDVRRRFRSAARAITAEARFAPAAPPPRPELAAWYAPHVLGELVALKQGVDAEGAPEVRLLLQLAFSSILVKVSHQESDTRLRLAPRDRPPGTTAVLFHKKARELARRLELLAQAVPPRTPEASIRRGDARDIAVTVPVTAVLTSPPYPTIYDYLPMQRLREAWFELSEGGAQEIGSRRSWTQDARAAALAWRSASHAWMAAVASALRPGGAFVVVIGDGLHGRRLIDAGDLTRAVAEDLGLEVVASARAARPDHARGTSRWEHAIQLRRRA